MLLLIGCVFQINSSPATNTWNATTNTINANKSRLINLPKLVMRVVQVIEKIVRGSKERLA